MSFLITTIMKCDECGDIDYDTEVIGEKPMRQACAASCRKRGWLTDESGKFFCPGCVKERLKSKRGV